MYTLKWSVLQYVILRPLLSIIAVICQYFGAVRIFRGLVGDGKEAVREKGERKAYTNHVFALSRSLIILLRCFCDSIQLCEAYYSPHFAAIYLDAVDFVSISIALYGLIVFYLVTKDELKGRRPLAKVSWRDWMEYARERVRDGIEGMLTVFIRYVA